MSYINLRINEKFEFSKVISMRENESKFSEVERGPDSFPVYILICPVRHFHITGFGSIGFNMAEL